MLRLPGRVGGDLQLAQGIPAPTTVRANVYCPCDEQQKMALSTYQQKDQESIASRRLTDLILQARQVSKQHPKAKTSQVMSLIVAASTVEIEGAHRAGEKKRSGKKMKSAAATTTSTPSQQPAEGSQQHQQQ